MRGGSHCQGSPTSPLGKRTNERGKLFSGHHHFRLYAIDKGGLYHRYSARQTTIHRHISLVTTLLFLPSLTNSLRDISPPNAISLTTENGRHQLDPIQRNPLNTQRLPPWYPTLRRPIRQPSLHTLHTHSLRPPTHRSAPMAETTPLTPGFLIQRPGRPARGLQGFRVDMSTAEV
jgi:hypothetical protein